MTVSGLARITLPGRSWAVEGRDSELAVHELVVNAVIYVGSPPDPVRFYHHYRAAPFLI